MSRSKTAVSIRRSPFGIAAFFTHVFGVVMMSDDQ